MASERRVGLPDYVRRLRLRAGLTQGELAERARLTPDTIGKLERGLRRRLYPHTARALADALDLDEAERADLAALAHGPRRGRVAPPILATAAAPPDAPAMPLPAPLTSFVGRERELAAAGLLVAQGVRLLTLTGPGGAGKTRLAVEGARALGRHFPAGVRFVELASLADPALVPPTVAAVLGVRDAAGRSVTAGIVAALRDQTALLILDNCEHLLDACADLIAAVLRGCPRVTVVATSREPLHVTGEQVYPVPPLALPPADEAPAGRGDEAAALAAYAAVALFVDRARAVRPEFALTAATAGAVTQICRRLDGLPLAIELAAARLRVLSPAQIAARLDDRFRLVAGGARDTPPRHQTLRTLIEWSHDLLTVSEGVLFRRLAVFAGGFSLEAAEAVCGSGQRVTGNAEDGADDCVARYPLPVARDEVLELLTALVDKSLVVAKLDDGAARYLLLESIREYATEKLAAAGEMDTIRRQHGAHYRGLAERAAPLLRGPNQVAWLRRLDGEHNNLREALRHAGETGNAVLSARLCLALTRFWQGRGYLGEGRAWFAAVLRPQASGGFSPLLRSKVLLGAGQLAHWQELAESAELLAGAVELARAQGAQEVLAESLIWLGSTLRRERAFAAAREAIEEGMALYRSLDDTAGLALGEATLGTLLSNEGDITGAVPWLARALSHFLEVGDARWIATTRVLLAECLVETTEDLADAGRILQTGLRELQAIGERTFMITGLHSLAYLAAKIAEPVRAARLLGATDALAASIGAVWTPVNVTSEQPVLRLIRAHLDEPAIAAARTDGRRLSLDDVLAEANTIQAHSSPS